MKRPRRKSTATQEVASADLAAATCGACLLELIDESEQPLIDQQLLLTFRKPTSCAHLYHKNCLEEWFKRDTSCPQCRLRVDAVVELDARGRRSALVKVAPVFLEDVLDAEESEEEQESGDEVSAETAGARAVAARAARRPRSARTAVDDLRRENERKITAEVLAETERMRKRLAEERSRELRQQRAILKSVDPLTVRINIVKSLRRLPYDLQTSDAALAPKVCVPTPPPKPRAPPVASFISLKPPSYERDFLSREKGGHG